MVRQLVASWMADPLLPFLHWHDLRSLWLSGYHHARLSTALVYQHALAALDKPLQGRHGACAVAQCPCMRSLRMILDVEGITRQFSWFPYCVLHKRQYATTTGAGGDDDNN